MIKLKKISAVFLSTGLISSTSIHVLANNTEIDTSNFETVNLQDALTSLKNESTSLEDLQVIVANIAAGLSSNNIFSLSTNIEKINNPQAKLTLQKNLDKAIAKYEEKNKQEDPIETSVVKEEPEVEKNASEADEADVEKNVPKTKETKIDKTEKQLAHKLEKAEIEAAKEARKAAGILEKQEQKAAQKAKKEERKASNHEKKDRKDNK